MKLTLSKTLLSAAVMLGLTACSSGGGGGSSSPNTTPSKNVTGSITVPNVDTANNNTVNSQKPNETITDSKITPSTFKVGYDGYATGKATYASARSTIRLEADFDNRTISGSAVGKIDDQNVNISLNNTTLYKGTARYINGNYPNYNKIYEFKGNASAIHNQEKFSGKYAGIIYGVSSPFSEMSTGYEIKSEKDPNRIIKEGSLYYNKRDVSYVTSGSDLNRQ
ncbi:hypothetical protein E4T80_08705 [Muribacter muris]|uniref:Transferrin-binding protein B C-lobe/N-lobe beta barrel domain-containing protein n=1 Tax=Muribacter muris TaxID=67855 RepID=A0A4Y9JXF4_9PAST|nr:hypothetical protein [Muribacter muris]MBF0785537.1 hypothetical protein [Muribacter muris]MBF0827148.1 hypothetical protein [Muribacter muris]TFV09155.1 hypothetical protein E4T80_08705 [Muribacter muris]